MSDIKTVPACEPAPVQLRSQTNPPHRVLVVDDDDTTRQLNTAVLLRSGYAVDAAENGAAAWEALCDECYDLMITDNNMPEMTGVELLLKLRAARMALPIIMATGALPEEEFARAPWLRPAAVLIKPYTNAEMVRTVKKVLREADGKAFASQVSMYRDRSADDPAAAPRPLPIDSARRILVVDKDSDLRLLYSDALARPGYFVGSAEDGAAAWETLLGNNYDLLITEHDLPKLTGIELIRKVRGAQMAIPIVMAAETLPIHELVRDPSLQLAATLTKPFAMDALLTTVRNVLRVPDNPWEQFDPPTNRRDEPPFPGLRH